MVILKKRSYKLIIFICVNLGIFGIILLYMLNSSLIVKAFNDYAGALEVVYVILIRVLILSITTFYLLKKWFKQEAQYLSDIPFLLSLFFLILAFGKAIDLFWDLTFFTYSEFMVLFLIKIRYIIIILEVAPLIYLGLEIVFFRLEEKFQKLKNKKYMNKLRFRIISILLIIELIIIIIAPNYNLLAVLLPIIVIPSLLGIVYIFYLAYRLNRLSVVKPKILTISFFLYLISNILRPVIQGIIGENAFYIIVVEIIDIVIFVIIFLGLYKKSNG